MKKNTISNSGRIVGAASLLAVLGFTVVALLQAGCGSKPTVEDTNDYLDLIRYIENNEDGRMLFRTEGLIVDDPYTKPNRPGVVFRDSLESVTRTFSGEIPGGFVEKDFGAPFGILDDAEFNVQDVFRVHILADSADTQLRETIQDRTLYRRAYFLRLRSGRDAYGGWLMHGFNGGTPRGMAGMEIKRSNGSMFLGDGTDYQHVEYVKYVTTYWPDPYPPFDSVTVDTIPDKTMFPYILVQDIARVSKGDELSILSFSNNTDYGTTSASVYQLISARTDSGPVYRSMIGPDYDLYTDTIRTPVATDVLWDFLFFQEFRFVDRPGGIWCVPYRVQ